MRGEGQIAELVGDRRAGRGRDRERRPGAPRAARHGRAGGRRQGGADPRPAPRAPPASCPPASRCWTRTCATTLDTWHLRPGRRRAAARLRRTAAAEIEARGERVAARAAATREPHNLLNTLAAVAAARALGVRRRRRVSVRFSSLRGEVVELPGGVAVVNDCYNANPMSMRAALDHLAERPPSAAIAVLGEMAELGPDSPSATTARSARTPRALGIDVLVPVGEDAARLRRGASTARRTPVATPEEAGALLEELAPPGDRVLSRARARSGLERVLGRRRCSARSSSPGSASLLICMFLGPQFIEFLRLQGVRPADPRGGPGRATTARRARRRWAGS